LGEPLAATVLYQLLQESGHGRAGLDVLSG
jgi:hypothetical protein